MSIVKVFRRQAGSFFLQEIALVIYIVTYNSINATQLLISTTIDSFNKVNINIVCIIFCNNYQKQSFIKS